MTPQHSIKPGHISSCQVCGLYNLRQVLDYGSVPLSDSLLTEETLKLPEQKYPLNLFWCENCSLAQIDYCVDPKILYHESYPYKSSSTKELVAYFKTQAQSLVSKYRIGAKDLVVDTGSNDGTFLAEFKNRGVRVCGVEPTGNAKIAAASGVETIQDFFSTKVAQQIQQSHGQAKLIVSNNVFERMSDLGEAILGIEKLLAEDGVLVLETHYLLPVITGGQIDSFYHEHLREFCLKSLLKLFSYYNLSIVEVEMGFGFRHNLKVVAVKGKDKPAEKSVKDFLQKEQEAGLYNLETYKKFAGRAEKTKKDFLEELGKLKQAGKTVVANSCTARSVVLLNYFGVGSELIPYIAEHSTSPKVGMFMPGTHIPVVNNQRLFEEQPDYVVLLAWSYAPAIMETLKAKGLTADFIIPLPDFTIVKNSDV